MKISVVQNKYINKTNKEIVCIYEYVYNLWTYNYILKKIATTSYGKGGVLVFRGRRPRRVILRVPRMVLRVPRVVLRGPKGLAQTRGEHVIKDEETRGLKAGQSPGQPAWRSSVDDGGV